MRLQTISNLYDFRVQLPARLLNGGKTISNESQNRIRQANCVVAICLGKMSAVVQQELTFAMQQNKNIVLLYDNQKGKTVDLGDYAHAQQIGINEQTAEGILAQIRNFLTQNTPKNDDSNLLVGGFLAVFGILLGFIFLANGRK